MMKNNPFSGIGFFLRGLGLIWQPGIRKFVIAPLLINIVVFGLAIYWSWEHAGGWIDWLETQIPSWLDWLTWLLWPVLLVALAATVFFGFTLVGSLIAAPFNGMLSEAVEHRLKGNLTVLDFSWSRLIRDIGRSLLSEAKKLLYFLRWGLLFVLLMFIPVIGQFLWVAFGSWMLAIEYTDFPMANRRLTFPEQRAILAQRRMAALGFGSAVLATLMIPLLNLIVIPAAVAGATVFWVEHDKASGTQTELT